VIPGLLVALLVIVALIYVSAPIRRPRPAIDDDQATSEAEARKVTALTAILDLESERDMGKLSDADFDELRSTYENDALAALAELDAAAVIPATDPLEREIAAMRERLRAGRCPRCGAARAPGMACSRCGA
jgi:hypothetical protein